MKTKGLSPSPIYESPTTSTITGTTSNSTITGASNNSTITGTSNSLMASPTGIATIQGPKQFMEINLPVVVEDLHVEDANEKELESDIVTLNSLRSNKQNSPQ